MRRVVVRPAAGRAFMQGQEPFMQRRIFRDQNLLQSKSLTSSNRFDCYRLERQLPGGFRTH